MSEKPRKSRWKTSDGGAASDLVRECGEKLTDQELWPKFQQRFQGLIFTYIMRSLRLRFIRDDVEDIVPDLAQEVYLKLLQNDGRILRSFKGTTEFSVRAFLTTISASVVLDYQRRTMSNKRSAQIIPIDSARVELERKKTVDTQDLGPSQFDSILSWIDIERVVQGEPDQKNAQRNALIFQLHYINGLESGEIARFPGFGLTDSGVQAILARLRKKIQE